MAIISPADMPSILKVRSEPMKKYVMSKLGGSVVDVELTEDQFETIYRVAGDFIAQYFPKEQRLSVFWTQPMKSTYILPTDAYWIQSVNWDPTTTRLDDIFGAESYLFNIGTISGTSNMLSDYHLLASYRKFAQKVLATEGHFEVLNEGHSTVEGDSLSSKDQLIRLYPTPKGAFPVVVLYIPVVTQFRSAQARQLAYDMMVAECKMMVGMARRKASGMPTPDGGSISYDGGELISEGQEARDKIIETAISLGEPLSLYLY